MDIEQIKQECRDRLRRDPTDAEINLYILTLQRREERQAWKEEGEERRNRQCRSRANKHAAELRQMKREFSRRGMEKAACRSTKTMRHGAILAVLEFLSARFGNKYCFPNQDTIRSLLRRWHGISMARSTLNVDLADLEDMGAISRIRRHRDGGALGIIFKSTVYYTSKIGKRLLSGLRGALIFVENNRVRLFGQDVSLSSKGKGLCPPDSKKSGGEATSTGYDGVPPPLPAT